MSAAVLGIAAWLLLSQPDLSELTRQFAEAERRYDLPAARTLVETQSPLVDVSTPTPHRQVYAASLLLRAQLANYASAKLLPSQPEFNDLANEAMNAAKECLLQLSLLPETPESVRMQADCYAELARVKDLSLNETNQWRKAAERAIAMDGANPRAHVAAARYHLYLRSYANALDAVARALELNPLLEPALITRALALDGAGRPKEAAEVWKQVLAQNPAAPPPMREAPAPQKPQAVVQ